MNHIFRRLPLEVERHIYSFCEPCDLAKIGADYLTDLTTVLSHNCVVCLELCRTQHMWHTVVTWYHYLRTANPDLAEPLLRLLYKNSPGTVELIHYDTWVWRKERRHHNAMIVAILTYDLRAHETMNQSKYDAAYLLLHLEADVIPKLITDTSFITSYEQWAWPGEFFYDFGTQFPMMEEYDVRNYFGNICYARGADHKLRLAIENALWQKFRITPPLINQTESHHRIWREEYLTLDP